MPDRGSARTVEVVLTAELAVTMTSGCPLSSALSLLSRSCRDSSGWSADQVAAEPQHQVTVGNGREVEAQTGQNRFHRTAQFLRVLQGAGAVEGQALGAVDTELFHGS